MGFRLAALMAPVIRIVKSSLLFGSLGSKWLESFRSINPTRSFAENASSMLLISRVAGVRFTISGLSEVRIPSFRNSGAYCSSSLANRVRR